MSGECTKPPQLRPRSELSEDHRAAALARFEQLRPALEGGDPNTGYLIGQTQTFPDGSTRYSQFRIGGTSLSSPILAGIMALADQAPGRAHGFANPEFYGLAGSAALHDVTNPSSTVAVVRNNYRNSVDATNAFSLRCGR